jgi:hypothetical protein
MNKLTHQDDGTREAFDPKHPSPAQWVGWLYGECTRREHARLEAHLEACAECRGQLSRWQTVTRELNAGALPKSQPARASWLPVIKWAAAALLVLGVGFMLGWRSHNPEREFAAWRQQLKSEWQGDFRQSAAQLQTDLETSQKAAATELASRVLDYSRKAIEQYAQQFARNYETTRQTESALVWDRLQALEDQRAEDYSALRKDLETLALTAAGEFWKTRRQLGGLIELAEGKEANAATPRLSQ